MTGPRPAAPPPDGAGAPGAVPSDPPAGPGPAGPGPADDPVADGGADGPSRRVLLAAGLAVTGALAGGAAGFARTRPRRRVVPDPVPPADVVAALARERELLAAYDAHLAGAAAVSPVARRAREDHRGHVAALSALLPARARASAGATAGVSAGATAGASVGVTAGASPGGPPAVPTAADLAAAETAAAAAARATCLAGNGTAAVLLACIAASEASHAAVLV